MRTALFLGVLPLLAATASLADPTPPTPPTPPPAPSPAASPPRLAAHCGEKATEILFAQATKPEVPGATIATERVVVYTTGAWTRWSWDGKGKVTSQEGSCLPETMFTAMRDELTRAPWKVTASPDSCSAVGASYVEFTVSGKVVWNQRACNASQLDAESAKVLVDVTRRLAEVIPPKPAAPPPCCKK